MTYTLRVDGPQIVHGPVERAVRVGDALMLECGTNLMSNPPANITWRNASGSVVVDGPRFNLINDDTGVRLGFTSTNLEDIGNWMCSVRVEGSSITMPDGEVVNNVLVGEEVFNITLYVIGGLRYFLV